MVPGVRAESDERDSWGFFVLTLVERLCHDVQCARTAKHSCRTKEGYDDAMQFIVSSPIPLVLLHSTMAWRCTGRTNHELISNLAMQGIISSESFGLCDNCRRHMLVFH